ncbi:MAG: hypothetical protein Q9214_002659 [Letrouitia sp. 1 TL-2023]
MSTTNVTTSTQDSTIPSKPAYINISPQSGSLRQPSPALAPKRPQNPRHKSSIRVEDSLTQPRDTEKHSKWPFFMRMHGSITPRMIVPLVFIGIWATIITCISRFVYPLVVSDLLLTVLGFVVGLGISFRTSSAYERYVDGRKYWGQLSQSSRDLARHLWIHVEERHDKDEQLGKADLLGKVTALNLIVAFAVALKHRLRYEPFAQYEDLEQLVSHLSTFANDAYDPNAAIPKQKSFWKESGEYLGLTFAESNPRKLLKRSPNKNFGNLPLEILTYLSAYTESVVRNGQLPNSVQFAMAMANLASLNEVLASTERVLNTPLPVAYSIAISQITWVYVILLPFQLWSALDWITIPGTIVGAYIILGIAAIGREIENPFGRDDNDLPLDKFCQQLQEEVNIIASKPPPKLDEWVSVEENRIFFGKGYPSLVAGSTEDIRAGLRARTSPRAREEVKREEKEEERKAGLEQV